MLPSNKISGKTKSFVDYQNDSTANDIKLALREGFKSIEHVKRYTTTGMATDQGKIANMHALGIISEITNTKLGELGTTTFRPPYSPITFGALVGRNVGHFLILLEKHQCMIGTKKIMQNLKMLVNGKELGITLRVMKVCMMLSKENLKLARTKAGILDASTLGKIDIQGSDALSF